MAGNGIAELIENELGELRQFISVLKREQQALTDGQTDSLLGLAEEKVRLAERLSSFDQQRDSRLRAAGFPPGREGMKAWQDTDLSPKIRKDLSAAISLATEARQLNEINGKL